MLTNYIKVALRTMWRQRQGTLINILGLSVGMAVCMLIVLYVQDELSFDRFHTHAERIYRVAGEYDQGGEAVNRSALTTYLLAPDLETSFATVEKVTRIDRSPAFVEYKDQQYHEAAVYWVDSTFLDIFSFPLIDGDASTALDAPNAVVVSQTMAEKYFGSSTQAVGEVLTFFDTVSVMVTGVMKDMPGNSHLQADFLVSLRTIEPLYPPWVLQNWGGTTLRTYVLLAEGASPHVLEEQINQQVLENEGERIAQRRHYFLQALTDIHLRSQLTAEISPNGDIRYVYLFSVVALLIVLIASINYINLATAYATKRAKEVGIRKVIGAQKKQIAIQFLSEAVLITGVAFLIAGLLTELSMPLFREITGKSITLHFLGNFTMMGHLFLIALLIGLLAGSYPAFFVTSFSSTDVLKGNHPKSSASVLRKSLVVFQFLASILLLIGTLIIFKQLHFLRHQKLGITTEQVLLVPLPTIAMQQQYETMKNRLLENNRFIDVTATNSALTQRVGGWRSYYLRGSEEETVIPTMIVEQDFFRTLEADFVAGRDFSQDRPTDVSEAYIINETAQQFLQLESPVNTPIIGSAFTGSTWSKKNARIIGVVKNFHLASLHTEIQPLIFSLHSPQTMSVNLMVIRVTGDIVGAVEYLETLWLNMDLERPLTYSFLDEDVYTLYQAEERFSRIFTIFSALALVIGGLGVYGLASFVAVQRTKEIGIRKVLGASVTTIVTMLSRDFIKLIIIALLIAVPIGYYAMQTWLQDFAYRTDISFGVFVVAGASTLIITLLTVSFQAIKAAIANPVDSLRNE